MHELTIASHVIEIVEENLKFNNAEKAESITLDVGNLSGVVVFALDTALKHLLRDTVNSHTEIIINEIPGMAKCNVCKREFPAVAVYDPCPDCGFFDSEIIRGEELLIKSIEIAT